MAEEVPDGAVEVEAEIKEDEVEEEAVDVVVDVVQGGVATKVTPVSGSHRRTGVIWMRPKKNPFVQQERTMRNVTSVR